MYASCAAACHVCQSRMGRFMRSSICDDVSSVASLQDLQVPHLQASRWDYQNSNIAAASGFGNFVSTLVDTPVCLLEERIQVVYGFWAVLEFWCLWM